MHRRATWATLSSLGILVVAGLVFYLSGFPGDRKAATPSDQVRRFSQEPRISVFVTQTGRREEMPIEEYVANVVAGEMWEGWPKSAYAAQAIIARTFTLEQMSSSVARTKYGTDVSTDPEETQAYNPSKVTSVIRDAVEQTRGQVLTYQGRYARAWFHAYSGGKTSTPEEGLGISGADAPYLRPVQLGPNSLVPAELRSWSVRFSADELMKGLAEKGVRVGDIQDVRLAARGPSGRITKVEVTGSEGSRTLTGNEFRLALGPDRIRSTLVRTFTFTGDHLEVAGTGSGHGVGLSQWDALLMARQGRSAQQIVQTFFPGTRVEKLW